MEHFRRGGGHFIYKCREHQGLVGIKSEMSRAGSLRHEHGFSPNGEFLFCSFFLAWGFVLFLVQATLVRQRCVNVDEFINLVCGWDSESI